jgi:hypothetical protein
MTDKKADQLVPLARSWLHAPEMRMTSEAYTGGIYDQSERAYLIENTVPDHGAPCTFVLEASEDSPVLNPAFIIKNWGNTSATLSINGKMEPLGADFRQGIRRGPYGEDLIVWIRLESDKPLEIRLE